MSQLSSSTRKTATFCPQTVFTGSCGSQNRHLLLYLTTYPTVRSRQILEMHRSFFATSSARQLPSAGGSICNTKITAIRCVCVSHH